MNVTIRKINQLEVPIGVEARVDEMGKDKIWKIVNDLVGFMWQWDKVSKKIEDMDSKIKIAGTKLKLDEVKKSQESLNKKIEVVNIACRNAASMHNASLYTIQTEMERKMEKERKHMESLASGFGLASSLVKPTLYSTNWSPLILGLGWEK